ncbi:MAG TPA: hypothetical protein VFE82_18030 [Ramlibacter sp.]|jgi:hypothetical protein|uniref:hypothetical protein n=1 Tax=Ramlibacter sp. TaxID=1917967 RepID=UPI002D740F95|nr:hypothetical protein [Ramlibacter sp.]HZY20375.1 hypothetical protein [Ramlibacter sp.]
MKLIKTDVGQRVMKDRSVPLSPRQRAAFILFDGRHSVDEVLAAAGAAGVNREDIDHLVQLGLLQATKDAAPAAVAPSPTRDAPDAPRPAGGPTASAQQRYQDAYLVATRLTASLGLRGFRLNLAVEQAADLQGLRELAPRIREAVGDKAFRDFERALNG